VVGGGLWLGYQNLWVFLVLAAVLCAVGAVAVRHSVFLKRLLASSTAMAEEVREAAITSFFKHQLYCTRDQSGLLIFISLLERKVWVLADRGISSRVDESSWQQAVDLIVNGIRQKRPAPAIAAAVGHVGDLLAQHFPRRPDDSDQLQGLIIGQ
jgi:putative membrane protein